MASFRYSERLYLKKYDGFFLFFLNLLSSVSATCVYVAIGAFTGAVSQRQHSWRKLSFPQQPPIANISLTVNRISTLPWRLHFDWLDLIQVLCAHSLPLYLHVCNVTIKLRNTVCRCQLPLALTLCLFSLLRWSLGFRVGSVIKLLNLEVRSRRKGRIDLIKNH